jgi:hypothetical protein
VEVKANRYTLPHETVAECKSLGMSWDEIFKYETYWLKKLRPHRTGKVASIDSEKQKVYDAEWKFQKKVDIKKFKDIREAEKRMKQITSSKLWSDLNGRATSLEHTGRMKRYAGMAYWTGKIKLANSGLDEYTLLHELAHQTPNAMHHGVQFRINLVRLVSRFMGTHAAKELKTSFKKKKLKMSMPQPRSPESWYKSYKRMEKLRERIS